MKKIGISFKDTENDLYEFVKGKLSPSIYIKELIKSIIIIIKIDILKINFILLKSFITFERNISPAIKIMLIIKVDINLAIIHDFIAFLFSF